ncbi:GNAT family N-acetyltransferase [Mycetocola spongiae]|uniref:GNAT family N-acetyltransferase n=1 Tax=Mycetocola spongiae TaxID=2859226 RepID=UPI001CF58B87|nr:GNAT family N-acetyltransferase [Mycetocola spongiae]UCR88598.1 GNAT family N-acetyltransferase [Mycetocola spongiae]
MNERTALRDRFPQRPELPVPRHGDVARWRAAGPEDIDAIWRLQRLADDVDHPGALSPRSAITETFETSNVDPAVDTLVAEGEDGELLAHGLVVVAGGHATRVQSYLLGTVHPLWRGRGIGGELFRWQIARSAQQLSECELALPGWTMLYVDARNTPLATLAGRAGLNVQRYFAEMEHGLDGEIPVLEAPEGVRIIPCSEEYFERTRVARNDAFRDHWGTQPNTKERWNRLVAGGHFRRDLSWIAVAAEGGKQERVVGFALSTVTAPAEEGFIELVGVIRDYRGRRLAPALLSRLLLSHREAGLPSVTLEVDSASPTGANTLYERLGFIPVGRSDAFVREY